MGKPKYVAVVRVVAVLVAACALSLGGAVAWAASAPPTGLTATAINVRPTTATLTGELSSRYTVTVTFNYGTTPSYGQNTPAHQYGGGGQPIATHADLSGLAPGTTYFFRMVATNQDGTATTTGQFTTPRAPSVTTGGASAMHQGTVTLSGFANPEGSNTTVNFEYGTNLSYGNFTNPHGIGGGMSSIAFHGDLGGLQPGRTYHYRAVATNANGTSYGQDRTFTPAAGPTVNTLAATTISTIAATLNGTANPGGSATTVTFEYGASTNYGNTTAGRSLGSGTSSVSYSVDITNLTPGATYHFRAVATNASGTIYGADRTFITTKKPTVTTGAVSSVTDTSATLNGIVNPAGATTTVDFQYGTDTSYGSLTDTQQIAGGTDPVTYQADITGLQPGTTYHFRALGTSTSGTATGKDVTFTTTGTKPSQSASPSAGPTATPTNSSATTHPKPSGFDPLLLVGSIALGVLLVGGFAVVALARGRN